MYVHVHIDVCTCNVLQSGSPGCIDTLYVIPPRNKDALKTLKKASAFKHAKKNARLQAFFPVIIVCLVSFFFFLYMQSSYVLW